MRASGQRREITAFRFSRAPAGWIFCEWSLMSNTLYERFIQLLQHTSKVDDHVGWQQNYQNHIKKLIHHASIWKGGKSHPNMISVTTVCKLKKLPWDPTQNTKVEMIHSLVQLLLKEAQEHDSTYRAPVPTTPAAEQLMTTSSFHVPVIKTDNERRVNKLVGTKEFKSMKDYQAYMQIGKYPLHASPCVIVIASQIDWEHPLVYEDWQLHRNPRPGERIRTFVCRRRRKRSWDEKKKRQSQNPV